MKRTFLVMVKNGQMDSVTCAKIIAALKVSKRIDTMEQVTFREIESSPAGAANLSAFLGVTDVCYIGLKVGAMVPLITKIDLTNKERGTVQHLIVCPDGPTRDLTKAKNVELYATYEHLAEQTVIKAFGMKKEGSAAVA